MKIIGNYRFIKSTDSKKAIVHSKVGDINMIIDTHNAEHYHWGDQCDGWHFVKSDRLSVIKETMPSMTMEKRHYHEKAQQFFYILSGLATFEINGQIFTVMPGKGILIQPGAVHQILNNTGTDLEFIVVSEPKSHGDRVTVE
jgi:mannose-6-phosphate isomerase-like protein (cupin superfamily)